MLLSQICFVLFSFESDETLFSGLYFVHYQHLSLTQQESVLERSGLTEPGIHRLDVRRNSGKLHWSLPTKGRKSHLSVVLLWVSFLLTRTCGLEPQAQGIVGQAATSIPCPAGLPTSIMSAHTYSSAQKYAHMSTVCLLLRSTETCDPIFNSVTCGDQTDMTPFPNIFSVNKTT